MSTIGIDWGNNETKIVTSRGAFKSSSCLGEFREFNIDIEPDESNDEIIYEYKGVKGFAGKLAEDQSRFRRHMAGDSKAHEDALIRLLIGIHRFTEDYDLHHNVVVGQPIKKHKAEKDRIVAMLKGQHAIKVNGRTKAFWIDNVAVAPEGAGAFWAYRGDEPLIRIIDAGSGTINCATVKEGRFGDRDSFTLPYGANSEEDYDIRGLANSIIAMSTKKEWKKIDAVRVCGGIAELITPVLAEYFTDIKTIEPMIREGKHSMRKVHPVFANAVGFYQLARDIYGG